MQCLFLIRVNISSRYQFFHYAISFSRHLTNVDSVSWFCTNINPTLTHDQNFTRLRSVLQFRFDHHVYFPINFLPDSKRKFKRSEFLNCIHLKIKFFPFFETNKQTHTQQLDIDRVRWRIASRRRESHQRSLSHVVIEKHQGPRRIAASMPPWWPLHAGECQLCCFRGWMSCECICRGVGVSVFAKINAGLGLLISDFGIDDRVQWRVCFAGGSRLRTFLGPHYCVYKYTGPGFKSTSPLHYT